MSAKGQSQLMVHAVGFTLGVMLFLIPVFILDYTVQVSVNNVESNYDEYESTVYSYRFTSIGENSMGGHDMLQKLRSNDCRVEGIEGRKIFLSEQVSGGTGECGRKALRTALPVWVRDSGMQEVYTAEVDSG